MVRVAIWILASMPAMAGGASADPAERARHAVQQIAAEHAPSRIVGFTVAVAKDGRVVAEAGFGRHALDSPDPMPAGATLDYFSVGKAVTAALLLKLADRGLVDLDGNVADSLPEADLHGAAVTPRHLLTHTSGLWEPELDETEPPAAFARPPPPGAVVAWANGSTRRAAPGETWLYSNHGFLFAGALAEAATGRRFEDLVEDELVAPLGLARFGSCRFAAARRAPGYRLAAAGPEPIPPIDPRWFGGAGSICGSAADLLHWWSSLDGTLITRSSFVAMTTPVRLARDGASSRFGYGLGLRLGTLHGYRKLGHTGNGAGGTSVLAAYPDTGWAIAVITNTAGPAVPHALEIEAGTAELLLHGERWAVANRSRTTPNRPLPPGLAAGAPGYYRSPEGRFCITRDGEQLYSASGDGARAALLHLGDGRFSGDDASAVEYFLGLQTGPAQWFGFDWHGFPLDLATRADERCPTSPAAGRSS